MKESKKDRLPEYKSLSVLLFIISIFIVIFIPVASLLILVILVVKIKKQKARTKPQENIYHFVKDMNAFGSILESRCLMSLTGGRCYATSIFNPYLGLSLFDTDNIKYVLVMKGKATNVFKPIISSYREVFLPWKWWKFFRGEYVSKALKDLEFNCDVKSVRNEYKEYNRFVCGSRKRVLFCYLYIDNLTELENDLSIYRIQKFLFWIGDIFLSVLGWIGIVCGNLIFLGLCGCEFVNSLVNYISKNNDSFTAHFSIYWVIYISGVFLSVFLIACLYFILRKKSIISRVARQKKKYKSNYKFMLSISEK